MIDALYYMVFVLVPVFLLGFQAVLLPIFFFLKARQWLSRAAFTVSGAMAGVGFGYLFAQVSGLPQIVLVCGAVAVFGVVSGWFWWHQLVQRETANAPNE